MATTKRGKPCGHKTVNAVWCFGFQSERFTTATWVESCGLHLADVHGQVASLRTAR